MWAANDNGRVLGPEERASFIERLREEFDILCLGDPTPQRIENELAVWGFA